MLAVRTEMSFSRNSSACGIFSVKCFLMYGVFRMYISIHISYPNPCELSTSCCLTLMLSTSSSLILKRTNSSVRQKAFMSDGVTMRSPVMMLYRVYAACSFSSVTSFLPGMGACINFVAWALSPGGTEKVLFSFRESLTKARCCKVYYTKVNIPFRATSLCGRTRYVPVMLVFGVSRHAFFSCCSPSFICCMTVSWYCFFSLMKA